MKNRRIEKWMTGDDIRRIAREMDAEGVDRGVVVDRVIDGKTYGMVVRRENVRATDRVVKDLSPSHA